MDIASLHQLYAIDVPFIKIGSGDTDNFPLIRIAAKHETPLIISTGMQTEATIRKVVEIMEANGKRNYCLLHCVSAYPTMPDQCTLGAIELYRRMFPHTLIGYSGHELGLAISLAAVCLGAVVIERHFTLDKNEKGTDHQLSLLPQELKSLCDNIRSIEIDKNWSSTDLVRYLCDKLSLGCDRDISMALQPMNCKSILACEFECHMKLGKSLVYAKRLVCGHQLDYDDICCKVSEPKGMAASCFFDVLRKRVKRNVEADELVELSQLE